MYDFLDRMQNIDRRIIYTLVFLVLMVPMFRPIGLPLKVTRETQAAFDVVESLPTGSLAMLATNIGPGVQAELEPQSVALLKHLVSRRVRVVLNPCAAESPRYCDRYSAMLKAAGYVEGTDFIQLPYLAGAETLYGAMGTDLKSAYSMVTPGQYPLWDSIKGMQDFQLFADCGGGESQLWALAHIEAKHNTPTICLITAVILAVRQPFFTSGQFKGIVSGLNGAAEYELLAKAPGSAIAGMDAQSLGHLWIIAAILLGNLSLLLTKGRMGARKGSGS